MPHSSMQDGNHTHLHLLPAGVPNNPNVAKNCAPQVDLAFAVSVKNDTTHSIDLNSTVIQLEDKNEKTYERDSSGRCTQSSEVKGETHNPKELVTMRVLPGKHRDGNVAFCLKAANFEFPGKLLIYDVPVETDNAGNVSRRENFVFSINAPTRTKYLAVGPNHSLQLSDEPPSCQHFSGSAWEKVRIVSKESSNTQQASSASSGLQASKDALEVAIQKASATGILRPCWQTYGANVGEVQATLTLDPSGSVAAVSMADTSGTSFCVSRALKTLRFDPFMGSGPVEYPMQIANPWVSSDYKNK